MTVEFKRVAEVLEVAASKQPERDQVDTDAIVAILQGKCIEVMARHEAGYFIPSMAGSARPSPADDRWRSWIPGRFARGATREVTDTWSRMTK